MNFSEFVKIVEKLRGPDGCPWDREQTRETLKPYLVEEFYELIDALDSNDTEEMKEELGDLLFQIVLQSQLSKEEGTFNIDDIVAGISEKMISRHPHVFGDRKMLSSEERREWWNNSKKKEGKNYESAMDGVPNALPALIRAQKLQMNATKVGFDWDNIDDVFKKLEEEITELKEALNRKDQSEIEHELGDIFFVLVRIANFVNVNPEDALRKTIRKFIQRFHYMESEAQKQGRVLSDLRLEEMEVLWNEAKRGVS
ncbi:MAG: nucleoside triphosphate pyrophosphohydrolase [Nitrospiraceae bacterium]|nr:MAG: nucleoside triphosphate pyrophosphohydrolase [Nitrospiraceae bacterium]